MEMALYDLSAVWLLVALATTASLYLWRKSGYWLPGYVHALALGALAMILYVNWVSTRSGGGTWLRRSTVVAAFPLTVYFAFITFGGVRAAVRRRLHPRSPDGIDVGSTEDETAAGAPDSTPVPPGRRRTDPVPPPDGAVVYGRRKTDVGSPAPEDDRTRPQVGHLRRAADTGEARAGAGSDSESNRDEGARR